MNKGGGVVVLKFVLCNYEPMNVIGVLKILWEEGKYVLENTWAYLNPAGLRVRG